MCVNKNYWGVGNSLICEFVCAYTTADDWSKLEGSLWASQLFCSQNSEPLHK